MNLESKEAIKKALDSYDLALELTDNTPPDVAKMKVSIQISNLKEQIHNIAMLRQDIKTGELIRTKNTIENLKARAEKMKCYYEELRKQDITDIRIPTLAADIKTPGWMEVQNNLLELFKKFLKYQKKINSMGFSSQLPRQTSSTLITGSNPTFPTIAITSTPQQGPIENHHNVSTKPSRKSMIAIISTTNSTSLLTPTSTSGGGGGSSSSREGSGVFNPIVDDGARNSASMADSKSSLSIGNLMGKYHRWIRQCCDEFESALLQRTDLSSAACMVILKRLDDIFYAPKL